VGAGIDHYDWSGGREAMLRFGPNTGPVLIAALPLFEEANRTRTFTVGLLRALAARGIASLLPDVPGQGESTTPLTSMTIPRMVAALRGITDSCLAEGRRTYALGIRSGALLDHGARHSGRWHFAPQAGEDLLRDLHRIWRAAGNIGDRATRMQGAERVEIAGNMLPAALLESLVAATPFDRPGVPRRLVDRRTDTTPLWRRIEPGNDPALAQALADDIATWLANCEL
jgi:hypothetical protein